MMLLFSLVFMCLGIECLTSIKSTNVATCCLFLAQEDCWSDISIKIWTIWSGVFGDQTNTSQIYNLPLVVLIDFSQSSILLMKIVTPNSKNHNLENQNKEQEEAIKLGLRETTVMCADSLWVCCYQWPLSHHNHDKCSLKKNLSLQCQSCNLPLSANDC